MASFLRVAGRAGSSVPKWAVGVIVATPTVAVLQGCLMLNDYRTNHRDAPHPISPTQGVVVVSPNDLALDGKVIVASPTMRSDRPPIRLLVIGDSLAAGVGTSKSGTPVLPESIARSLSKALGGRSVYWTCVGTPGASASQIVHDINNFDDGPNADLPNSKLARWQETAQRVHQWLKNRDIQRESQETVDNQAAAKLATWWRGVRRDVRDLKAVIRNENAESSSFSEESTSERKEARREEEAWQIWRRRKPCGSLSPDTQYDIAVVLTGLNDLKDSMLPWMSQMDKQNGDGGLKAELLRVVHALKSKMKPDLHLKNQEEQDPIRRRLGLPSGRPLVVFPALPASSLPIFQSAPLSWFAVPLFHAMDNNKKVLSEKFPRSILFVESPSHSLLSDFEAGRGKLWAKRQTEEVLLKLTDVTHKARGKVEHLMAQHYEKWKRNDQDDDTHHSGDEPRDVFEQSCHDHQWADSSDAPGASLIAADKVHPNDEGYDFWGRHIAEAIVQEWNK